LPVNASAELALFPEPHATANGSNRRSGTVCSRSLATKLKSKVLGCVGMRRSTAAVVTSGAVLGGVSAMAAYGTVAKSSQLFGPSIYRGPGKKRTVALTFDDGPCESTMELLEYLDQEDVRATFFMCGRNVERLPGIAGRVAAAGHEIGNHTYSHPYLPFKSPGFIEEEFRIAQDIIEEETGVLPLLLRPPYGFRWFGLGAVQRRLSLLAVLWTVIGNDWKWPRERIAQQILQYASPGGIICLHDGRTIEPQPDITETLAAVRILVPVLRDQGYDFETVGQLLS
jgi:peptidoglycan-N-acetylglucosamine deacetylase